MEPTRARPRRYRVLVVDDDAGVRSFIAAALDDRESTIEVVAASDGVQAWERVLSGAFDLVLTDLNMPHMNGVELIDRLRRHRPEVRLLLMSGASADWQPELERRGAADLPLLTKPVSVADLRDAVWSLLNPLQPA